MKHLKALTTAVSRRLVATSIGTGLLYVRQRMRAIKSVAIDPEQGGCVCQELLAERLLANLCRPGRTFIDVGSHVGSVVAQVRRHCPHASIIAIEADPEKSLAIRHRFPSITVHTIAAAEAAGTATFYIDEARSGYSSLLRSNVAKPRAIEVDLRPLDDIVQSSASVDIVKIDVEGAEIRVLRGADALVHRCRPLIVFESATPASEASRDAILDVFDWLAKRCYGCFLPNRVAHDGPPLGRDAFFAGHFYPRYATNYFAIPEESRTLWRDSARRVLGTHV